MITCEKVVMCGWLMEHEVTRLFSPANGVHNPVKGEVVAVRSGNHF